MAKFESSLMPGRFFGWSPLIVHEGRSWRGKQPPSRGASPRCKVLLSVSLRLPAGLNDWKNDFYFLVSERWSNFLTIKVSRNRQNWYLYVVLRLLGVDWRSSKLSIASSRRGKLLAFRILLLVSSYFLIKNTILSVYYPCWNLNLKWIKQNDQHLLLKNYKETFDIKEKMINVTNEVFSKSSISRIYFKISNICLHFLFYD